VFAWTDENVARLKADWPLGLSAGLIARQIGGTTRNAVIGKVHRLGLPGRTATLRTMARGGSKRRRPRIAHHAGQAPHSTPQQELAARAQIAQERAAVQAPPREGRPILLRNARSDVMANDALDERAWRWTFGDGTKDDPFYCCGKPKAPGLPYCDFHARRAFNPVQPEHRRWPSRQGYVRHVADIRTLETLEPT
jgi:GcrA cell cycle regulator